MVVFLIYFHLGSSWEENCLVLHPALMKTSNPGSARVLCLAGSQLGRKHSALGGMAPAPCTQAQGRRELCLSLGGALERGF